MRILGMGKLFQIALLAGAAVVMCGTDASAWSYGSYGGSYGCYGCYGSYGVYGPVGPLRRMGARIRARRMARASYYGCYGCYGGTYAVAYSCSCYGYYDCCGCGCCYDCCGSYGGAVYGVPVETAPVPEPAVEEVPDSASIRVSLPADAKVFVNDKPTTSTGTERTYVSNGLRSGMTYSYKFRVEFERDGERVVENRLVQITAGQSLALNFAEGTVQQTAAAEPEGDKTVLILRVPQDAVVFLADTPTTQTGALRTYSTSRLAAGEQWKDYTIRVEVRQDGQLITQEQALQLEAGRSYELAFDFSDPATEVAAQLAQLTK